MGISVYPDCTSRNKKEIENQAIPITMPSGFPGAEDLIWWKKNDPVDEEHLLQKFKGLRFYFPDKDAVYKVCDKNLDWKKNHGWVAIAEKEGGSDSDDEPLTLALVCELVAANVDKNEGIEIVTATEEI